MSEINLKLTTIPEVEHAVLMTKDGVAVDDTSYEADFLGAHTQFLVHFAEKLGLQLGAGELKSATVQGNEHHVFFYDSKRHYLGLTATGAGNVNALDAEIRRVLAQK